MLKHLLNSEHRQRLFNRIQKPFKKPLTAEQRSWLLENVRSLGTAIFVVLLIRSVLVEPFKIPSGSMIPTLHVGDHIFVNKMAFGLKLPFVDWFNTEPIYLYKGSPPHRGDVVVFKYPKDESVHYIKRVIAMPGDKISVVNKTVYLNGIAIPQRPAASTEALDRVDSPDLDKFYVDLYEEENMTTHQQHWILMTKTPSARSNYPEVTVPAEHLFVMGDNRDYSSDSRFWGFVPFKNLRGKAMIVWVSFFLDFDTSSFSFHPERTGSVIR